MDAPRCGARRTNSSSTLCKLHAPMDALAFAEYPSPTHVVELHAFAGVTDADR
jgi:hypothetical protein